MQADRTPQGRRIAGSVTELFGREVAGEPLVAADGKSGTRLERVTVDGRSYVLKYLHLDDDWVMRATGDLAPRAVTVWRDGWLDQLPPSIDHATAGVAWDERPGRRGAVIVMHDVGPCLVPEGDTELSGAQHAAFVEHMAELHAAFWGLGGGADLLPLATRLTFFGPRLSETERARGGTDLVPTRLVAQGWDRFGQRAPDLAPRILSLLDDPGPLVTALRGTPQTLVHGDWKAGNLGSHPDGRTILLDWAMPGVAPACSDIAWYVCLNRARLPETKEAALDRYRQALDRQGIDTDPWWERQCTLALLGTFLQFGWEKALGEDDEFDWWRARAAVGLDAL